MAVYVIEFFIVIFFGLLYRQRKISSKIFVIISFSTMALLLSLRSDSVGEDTKHYIDVFNYAQNIPWNRVFFSGLDVTYATIYNASLKVESGFIIINKIIGLFTKNPQWFLAIISCTTCFLFGKFVLDNSDDVFFSTYVFLCESLFMNSFNLIRQIFALAIAVQAYALLKNNKIKSSIAVILLASCFHKTVIVWLLFVLFIKFRDRKKAIKYSIFIMVLSYLSLPVIERIIVMLVPRYQSYFLTNYWTSSIGGVIVLWLIEIVICILLYRNKINDNNYISIIACLFYLGFEVKGIDLLSFSRVAMNFRVFLIMLFPQAEIIFGKRTRKIYRMGIMAILAVLYFSYAGISARHYSFFWE